MEEWKQKHSLEGPYTSGEQGSGGGGQCAEQRNQNSRAITYTHNTKHGTIASKPKWEIKCQYKMLNPKEIRLKKQKITNGQIAW